MRDMTTLLFRLSLRLGALLSRKRAHQIAGLLAMLLKRSESAETTETNLSVCFPDLTPTARTELKQLSLRHMVLLFFELAALRYWSHDRLLAGLELANEAVLKEALAEEKGVILLVPHLGNWELMCVFLGHYYSVAALYDPPKVGGLESEIKTARERFSGKMFAIGIGGMRSVLKELKAGGLVAILPDQVPDRDAGVYAPFYKRPALTMTLPYQLEQKTTAAVLMGSVTRQVQPDGHYGYQLSFIRLNKPTATVEEFCTRMNLEIEQQIAHAPEQYQWEYKRFKRPPEGGRSNIYRRQ